MIKGRSDRDGDHQGGSDPTERLVISDPTRQERPPWRSPFAHEIAPVEPGPGRPGRGCRHFTLDRDRTGPGAVFRWEVEVLGPGIHPDLFAPYWSRKPCTALAVQVRNSSAVPVKLSAALHDTAGTWAWHPPRTIPSSPRPCTLRFPLTGFTSDRRDPPLAQPLKQVLLRITDPPREQRLVLELGEVWLETAGKPPASQVLAMDGMPARAGGPIEMAEVPGSIDPSEDSQWLALRQSDDAILGWWPAGRPFPARLDLPAGLSPGRYRFELWAHGERLAATPEVIIQARVIEQPVQRRTVTAPDERASSRHDTPLQGPGYMTYNPRTDLIARFGSIGVDLVSVTLTVNEHAFDLAPPLLENAHGMQDYTLTDALVTSVLAAHPRARLLLRLYLGSPARWDRAHPDERACADRPDGTVQPLEMVFLDSRLRRPAASLSSKPLRKLWEAHLEAFLSHLREVPWADRVVGILLAAGASEEWFHWYDEECPERWGDVGPAARRGYARWLRQRYGTLEKLRAAWNDPTADFNASLPERARREHGHHRFLRDPLQETAVIDFFRFQSETIVEAILPLARRVKQEREGRFLVGVFYGYLMVFTGSNRHLHGGHLASGRLLESPDIDFVCAPTGYGRRQAGEGFSFSMIAAGSVHLHGKQIVNENDLRTHLVRVPPDLSDIAELSRLWGFTRSAEETVATQRRELGRTLQEGAATWWCDLYPYGLYDDPVLMRELSRHVTLLQDVAATGDGSVAEVAVLVDEDSILHETPDGTLHWHAVEDALEGLARMGAPYEVFLLDDLPAIPPRKLYMFLNAWAPSEKARRTVESLRGRAGVTLLFCGPAGLYRHGRIDAGGPESFCGLPLALSWQEVDLESRILDPGPLATAAGAHWGPSGMAPPWVMATGARNLVVAAENVRGEATLVLREPPADRSSPPARLIHSASPAPPAVVLRAIARRAGVHVYCKSDDQCFVTHRTLTIHARTGGVKHITLPEPQALVERFGEQHTFPPARTHEIKARAGETRLLLRGNPAEW